MRNRFPKGNSIAKRRLTGKPSVNPKGRAGDVEARRISRALLARPKFQASLKAKLDDCSLHPSVLVALLQYAWGKPKETIETKQVTPVRVVHVYSDEHGS